mmetsp:Transcript_28273/g.46814  ORF Transcript_28273/g.46814 Transcript_28273/m.46814 type:complete len:287 (+) Transcript_28273:34-894(+)
MYSEKQVKLYAKICEKHRQSTGPWPKITEACRTALLKSAASSTEKSAATSPRPHILDIACGPGEPATMLAQAMPHAQVVATDYDQNMVDMAEQNAACIAMPNLTFQIADMQDLNQFPSDSFDAVTCCYGIMFPEDKDKAFREIYRVLKPNGSFIATYWTRVLFKELGRKVMEQVLGHSPPPRKANPLFFAEPGMLESMLTKEHLFDDDCIAVQEYSYDFTLSHHTDDDETLRMCFFPMIEKLDELQGWAIARKVFDEHKLEYGDVDANGIYVVRDNFFKMVVATKR